MTDHVAMLRLEGGKANAMAPELLATIERTIDGFENSSAHAAVLTGYERYFSGGLALTHIIDLDRVQMRGFIEQFSRAMTRVFACEKPIVAAINGHAIAGGCVLALMCDWRISASDDAIRIGLNETQLGIGLPAVVIEPLRAQVPASSLVPIALEGQLFSPTKACELGLVHEIIPAPNLLDRAAAKARMLAELSPIAVRQVKRALRAPILEAIARSSESETALWLDTWYSGDGQSRLRAAVAKLTARS